MQKSFSSGRSVSLLLAFGLALANLVLMAPRRLQAASGEQTIAFSGERITSIFDGLTPNRFPLDFVSKQDNSRNLSRLWEQELSDAHLGARYLQVCTGCLGTGCFGHYLKVVPCYGCCTDSSCDNLGNYETNTQEKDEDDGVLDNPCNQTDCCDNFYGCGNP